MSEPSSEQGQAGSVCAVLIAGGKSSRMGRDKAELLIAGRPLWARQLETLQALAPRVTAIAGRADGPYASAGVMILPDEEAGLGPLSGLISALRLAREGEWVVVFAVDLPQMPASYLRQLIVRANERGRGQAPHHGERYEPLAAVYSPACLSLALERATARALSLQGFLERAVAAGWMEPVSIAPEEEAYFANVNTPEEARAAGLSAA